MSSKSNSGLPTVLVVEEEPFVRMTTVINVEDAGYVAIGVTDAAHARQALAKYPQIAAVITAVPATNSMGGAALVHEALRLSPGIKVLILSSGAQLAVWDLPPRSQLLAKPYTFQQIADSLHQLLA